jgi:alkylation response protein AidB-like acyl-CoA dehydrogenase
VHQPGIEIKRIKQINGNTEFCQEFFDDVQIPVSDVVGEINGGWAVASRQLFHERNAVGGGSPYVSGPSGRSGRGPATPALAEIARRTGQSGDAHVRELIAEAHTLTRVQQQLINRVVTGMRSDQMPAAAAAVIRLFGGDSASRRAEIGLEVAGSHAAAAGPDGAGAVTGPDGAGAAAAPEGAGDGLQYAEAFLMRQAGSLGGGSTEMARNIISERILGMPREYAADRDVPFSQVRHGKS